MNLIYSEWMSLLVFWDSVVTDISSRRVKGFDSKLIATYPCSSPTGVGARPSAVAAADRAPSASARRRGTAASAACTCSAGYASPHCGSSVLVEALHSSSRI